jgi:hypothetical protein
MFIRLVATDIWPRWGRFFKSCLSASFYSLSNAGQNGYENLQTHSKRVQTASKKIFDRQKAFIFEHQMNAKNSPFSIVETQYFASRTQLKENWR